MKGLLIIIAASLFALNPLIGQDESEETVDKRPVRDLFSSAWLMDNQTPVVPIKGTLEFDIIHRFGPLNNGYDDLYGIFAPSNIKFGLTYSVVNQLSVGFGYTKGLLWDFNVKYAILDQTRSGSMPFALTYYANTVIDTRSEDRGNFRKSGDRYSYFHQLILARKFSSDFSFQVAPSFSHYNVVAATRGDQNEVIHSMEHDHFALSFGARYKLGSSFGVIANYDQPITHHNQNNPHPNLGFGVEMVTSSHAFQIFISNFYNILPQRNNVFNRNDFQDGEFLIGFNITRLWNF